MTQPPKSFVCVLCGSRPAETRDHVPPKCLFEGLSADLITVPACGQCNNGASSDDEDFRFYVSAQVGKPTREAARLWDDGALKSFRRKTKLREFVKSTMREETVQDVEGNSVVREAFRIPESVYQSVFERTTRGLYFHHTGRILPATTRVQVTPLSRLPEEFGADAKSMSQNSIGGDAFIYWRLLSGESIYDSIWVYQLHGALWFLVDTGDHS